jgi:uncharacterized protein (DUF924 family)
MNIEQQNNIIDFWFSDYANDKWFAKNEEFDTYIRDNFFSLYGTEVDNFHINKVTSPEAALSYILIFDQFPRNMFRGSKQAFATDNIALAIAKNTVRLKYDLNCTIIQRKFLYMPFMHSEDLADQGVSVELFSRLDDKLSLDFAIRHKRIIERFNRFPHRNHILERTSTEEEIEFLKHPESSF